MKNVEKIRGFLDESFYLLYDDEGSALERVRKCRKSIQSAQELGVDLKDGPALLEESLVRMEELVERIERSRNSLSADPKKLDEVIARQDLISKLKRKYGKTVAEIVDYGRKVGEDLSKLEAHTETLAKLEEKIAGSYDQLLKGCRKLSSSRKKSAEKLSGEIERELKDLGFLKARFSIRLAQENDEQPTSDGMEKIEFFFSANPGEDLQPLKAVASGGELSRVMLALKKILAQAGGVPALIFDEVDSGIGGSMGHVIGEKLKALSRSHQILAITHLPQIAAFAHRHIAVRKSVEDKRTRTAIESLEKDKRVQEIARMLGGIPSGDDKPTAASLKHASELLQHARN